MPGSSIQAPEQGEPARGSQRHGEAPPPSTGRREAFGKPASIHSLRGFLAPLFDPTVLQDGAFPVRCEAKAVGHGLLARIETGPLTLDRSPSSARRGGWDHRLVLLLAAGACEATVNGHDRSILPGDIGLFDMARPFGLRMEKPSDLVAAFLPRDERRAGTPPHGRILRAGETARALIEPPMRLIAERAYTLSETEGRAVAAAIAIMAAVPPGHGGEKDMLGDLRALIEARFCAADETPASLAVALGMSRTALYRLAAPEGGVGAMLQDARLRHAADRLMEDERPARSMAEIAQLSGLSSQTHFSRIFRQRFGLSPLRFRALWLEGGARRVDPRFSLWLGGCPPFGPSIPEGEA